MKIAPIGNNYSNKNRFGSIKYNIKPGVDKDHVAGVKADIILHSVFAAYSINLDAIRLALATALITKPEDSDDYPVEVTISPKRVTIKMPQTELRKSYDESEYSVFFHPKNKYIVNYTPGNTPDNLFYALKKANKHYFDRIANAYTAKWFMEKYGFEERNM